MLTNNDSIHISRSRLRVVFFGLLFLQSGLAAGVSTTQIDRFTDGTLQGWAMGSTSVTNSHMTNIATGGPAGTGDRYLEVLADNTTVAGGRLTFFNKAQWIGDYPGAGITAIAMDLKNFSSTEALNLRLAIEGGPNALVGGLFATTASVSLVSGSDWTHVVFSLAPGDLVPVSGNSGVTGNNVTAALGNVVELRLLNSVNPDWTGAPVTATLGIDKISAVVVPLPLALLLFGSGLIGFYTLQFRRRRSFW
ncbi:MAG: hypothetical protein QNL87_09110 [Gammaproteobacteria bacterium]|nr:hypothetical protein [Gammaproteobacteria bacterium]